MIYKHIIIIKPDIIFRFSIVGNSLNLDFLCPILRITSTTVQIIPILKCTLVCK